MSYGIAVYANDLEVNHNLAEGIRLTVGDKSLDLGEVQLEQLIKWLMRKGYVVSQEKWESRCDGCHYIDPDELDERGYIHTDEIVKWVRRNTQGELRNFFRDQACFLQGRL